MRKIAKLFSLALFPAMLIAGSARVFAQDAASAVTATTVPHVVQFSGTVPGVGSEAVTLRFALYATEKGGEPVWSETQSVTLDAKGRYSALLGASTPGGLPQSAFNHGEAKWLGISVGSGEEQPRTVLVATPYSLKASDAETVGGHPAADFLLAPRDANGKPETATPVTQINTSSGVLGGGTGPTVNLTLDTAYLTTLGNGAYAQLHAANTFTGNQTINGNLSVTGSGIVSNLLPGGAVDITHSGSVYTIGLDAPQAITFGNTYWAQIAAANLFKGKQTLAATGTATSSTAYNSNALAFTGSAYNSTASAPEAINFLWQLEPSGNNTTAPAGTLNLLYGTGTNAPAETGLKIGTNGRLTFASGQTFPGTGVGTITGITTSGALTGGGTSGSVALSVTASSVETTLGTYYAKTGAANTFTGNQTITGTESASTSSTGGVITGTNSNTMAGAGLTGTGFYGVVGTGSGATSNGGTFGAGYGVSGTGYSGVYGTTNATGPGDGIATGVIGYVPQASTLTGLSAAVFGEDDQAGGIGLYGYSAGTGATGVYSYADLAMSATGGSYGVKASGNIGVLGTGTTQGVTGVGSGVSQEGALVGEVYSFGVWGDSNASGNFGLAGTEDDGYGAFVGNNSPSGYETLYVENDDTTTTAYPLYVINSSNGTSCNIDPNANLSCSGTVSVVHAVGDHQVKTYGMQSAENWIEDFGSGKLAAGSAHIDLEPSFVSTVNTGVEYHVFLTPRGDSEGLFVENTGPGGFDVRESKGGHSAIGFDYRIVAKRRGMEQVRMEDVTERHNRDMERHKAIFAHKAQRAVAPRKPMLMRSPMLPTAQTVQVARPGQKPATQVTR